MNHAEPRPNCTLCGKPFTAKEAHYYKTRPMPGRMASNFKLLCKQCRKAKAVVNESVYVIQKPGVERVTRWEKNGVRYAYVPPGTIVVTTLDGWDFVLPDKTVESVNGHPMELKEKV
jgi:hypothetical protein